ncbi:MAG: Antibiotic biosynthesis monooxygenase [Bradyrhizobium sp.]|nr:Antibiotic biosynthesis monooxygenase [Bradyrhizobium sp.]
MITLIARLTAKEGELDNLRATALELGAAVTANEPGSALFSVSDGPDPNTLILIERYVDDAALEAHRASDHLKTVGRKMGPALAGKPDILFRLTECA